MQPSSTEQTSKRPRLRPPIGIPGRSEARAQATLASVLLHLGIILLILAPTLFVTTQLQGFENKGAGGKGPVGGGGGGTLGSGGLRYLQEKLQYLKIAWPEPKPVVVPPKEEVKPKPVDPPKPPEAPKPTAVDTASSQQTSETNGTGGGTGKDGSSGSGTGSGGGVGSGVGTGRGSGNGPGTGGGDDVKYPPSVISLPILPLPVPSKVRPYKMVAYFEVDSTGVSRLLSFNPSKDSGYNRRIREMLMEIRFRPAVWRNGVAVRDTAVVTAEAM